MDPFNGSGGVMDGITVGIGAINAIRDIAIALMVFAVIWRCTAKGRLRLLKYRGASAHFEYDDDLPNADKSLDELPP
jgi:hypothetical protein